MRSGKISLILGTTFFYAVVTFSLVFSSLFLTRILVMNYSVINYSRDLEKMYAQPVMNLLTEKNGQQGRSSGGMGQGPQFPRALGEFSIFYDGKFVNDPFELSGKVSVPRNLPSIESIDGIPYIFVGLLFPDGGKAVLISTAYQLQTIEKTLNFVTLLLSLISTLAVVFTGFFFSKRITLPIRKISAQLEKVKASDLDLQIEEQKYSEYQSLADTLNSMLSRLNEGFSAQDQFVTDVSHELRTPLSAILANLEMVLRWAKDDPALLDESLNEMEESVKKLIRMVETLLGMSKGSGTADLKEIGVRSVVDDVFTEMRKVDGGFDFTVSGDASVKTDAGGFREILKILVENAVKYSGKSRRIIVDINKTGISVKDFGNGIKEDDLPRIFDRFYRTDSSRGGEGFGLGLSIAKKIADSLDLSIAVKSEIGKGSVFTVSFPK